MTEPHDLDPNGPDLTTKEVGARLRLDRRTVIRYASAGVFPGAYKTVGPWRIPQSGVIEFIQNGQIAT
jgi:predicted site-specific integrase-resolvase